MTTPIELKRIREGLGLDQMQFAEKLGYSRQFISDMERGAKPITLKTEAKLKELGLLKDELEEEYNKELSNLSDLMGKDPKLIEDILNAVAKDPDLMRLAAKVVNDNDMLALERFNKLVG